MAKISLARFADLETGTEHIALPTIALKIRENGFVFPANSAHLTPVEQHPIEVKMPRFSHFHFREASVHGFRLLSIGAKHCHDSSLVSEEAEFFPSNPKPKMHEDV